MEAKQRLSFMFPGADYDTMIKEASRHLYEARRRFTAYKDMPEEAVKFNPMIELQVDVMNATAKVTEKNELLVEMCIWLMKELEAAEDKIRALGGDNV